MFYRLGENSETPRKGEGGASTPAPLYVRGLISSTDVIQLTLKMTIVEVVETPFTVNHNSPIQDYVHPNDQGRS